MAHIKISGVAPWDGEYPFDMTYFTNRELHTIRTISDVRAGELQEEFERGNNDLLVAVAVCVAKRSEQVIPVDDLWDAPVGSISFGLDAEEAEDDAGPPAKPTPNETTASGVSSEQPGLSSRSSNGHSDDPQGTIQSTIGAIG